MTNITNETQGTPSASTGAQDNQPLHRPYTLGPTNLPNRIVMSPMTRGRTESPNREPGDIEAKYYAQRASAGLIITGGTYVSQQAIGGIRVPGIYTDAQVEAWKRVTDAVHAQDGRIFLQLAHSGSISHPDLLGGELPVAPSSINPLQKIFTPGGFKDTVEPHALTPGEIRNITDDFSQAAKRAKDAGFDGVELHSANTYLLPQFLNTSSNRRDDDYGGSPEHRARIVLEILAAISAHWTSDRIGIKLSPGLNGVANVIANDDTLPTYDYLIHQLNEASIAYLHLMRPINDVSQTAVAVLQDGVYKRYRRLFQGTIVANFGFDSASANQLLRDGDADLVSFARSYIANPDLVRRFANNLPLADGNRETYYQGGAEGYTSYPPYDQAATS